MTSKGPTSRADELPSLPATADGAALAQATQSLLRPLAALAVSKGVPFADLQEQLKQAFVEAASAAHDELLPHRRVSRIATATGLSRREVTRLTHGAAAPSAAKRPLATEVFARWLTDPAFRDKRGAPRVLPRQGAAPSFEALAQAVTRDVHPRSLLDELVRLGLAQLDEHGEHVRLVRDAFVPRGDAERMFEFLGQNVGDHLSAAVANVLGDGRQHFEQAVFCDELSEQSIEALRALITAHWKQLVEAMVPAMESLIEEDRAAARTQDRRVRVGLYSYTEAERKNP